MWRSWKKFWCVYIFLCVHKTLFLCVVLSRSPFPQPVPIKMKVYGVDYDNEHGIDMFTEEEAGTRRFKFPVVEQLCWEDAIVKAGSARVMRVLLERDGVRKSGHSGVEIARRVALYGWKRSADWAIRTCALAYTGASRDT